MNTEQASKIAAEAKKLYPFSLFEPFFKERQAYIAARLRGTEEAEKLILFVKNLGYMNGTKPQYEFTPKEIYESFLTN